MTKSGQRRTRVEDYLLAVEQLCRDADRAATGKLAAVLGIANGTAVRFLRRICRPVQR